MYNKSQFSKDRKAAKEPKKLARPKDRTVDLRGEGFLNPNNQSLDELTLYTDSIYNPTPYDLMLFPDNGAPQFKPAWDSSTTFFPGANEVTEVKMEDGSEYMDLTDEEIQAYRDGGYIVEELPKAQDGIPYNTAGPAIEQEPVDDGLIEYLNSRPQVYGHEPEDYNTFLAYSETAPENRRPYGDYVYGQSNDYDHYGMWEALGKPKNFEEALQINPDWEPDPYDGFYHGFSVNPYTGVFLKSGKPGLKEGDTTFMEIAGHYLSPRAQMDTPVFDIDLQRFRYIPNKQYGGTPKMQNAGTTQKLDSHPFEKGKSYTYESRPGSFYKLGDNDQILIKNKDTDWKYVEMQDPKGERYKTLQEGFKYGHTKEYVKPTSTINDFMYSKEELKNEQLRERAKQCFKETGSCAASAFRYYDKYVAPNLGDGKSSWQLKELNNMSSGLKDTNPRFEDVGESWDSWELAGGFLDAGGKLHWTSRQNKDVPLTYLLADKTEAERDQYYRNMKIPIGTIINAGQGSGDTAQTLSGDTFLGKYNYDRGLAPSNHTAIVVGYDQYGTPYIFDEGEVRKISDPDALVNAIGITNIVTPKQNAKYTYDYIKSKNKLNEEIKPLDLKVPGLGMISDKGEMEPFLKNLEKHKQDFMNTFNISNDEYDELARISAATALAETKGGQDLGTWRYGVIPAYLTDKIGLGDSQGITQINPESVWNYKEIEKQTNNGMKYSEKVLRNPTLVKNLENLGITKDSYDPWNPYHQAAVTLGLTKDNIKIAKANASKNPHVSKNLSDAELAYYQWNIPSALTTDDYDAAARGDNENVKRFMEYYNIINTKPSASGPANKKKGGSIKYEIGHMVDEKTMRELEKQGYTFREL